MEPRILPTLLPSLAAFRRLNCSYLIFTTSSRYDQPSRNPFPFAVHPFFLLLFFSAPSCTEYMVLAFCPAFHQTRRDILGFLAPLVTRKASTALIVSLTVVFAFLLPQTTVVISAVHIAYASKAFILADSFSLAKMTKKLEFYSSKSSFLIRICKTN